MEKTMKNRLLAALLAAMLAIVSVCTAAFLFARADDSVEVQSYSLFTQPGSINNIANTTSMWELDIEFSVPATAGNFVDGAPGTVPDAASKAADITVNGKTMAETFTYVYGTFPEQYRFAYIQWVASTSGNRLLKLYLPVNLYDYTAFPNNNLTMAPSDSGYITPDPYGYKGDGTDVVVLPAGLTLPEGVSLDAAQTLNITAEYVSGNETQIIRHTKLDQIDGADAASMTGWLYFVPVMNVTATIAHEGNVETSPRYGDYVVLNGQSVTSMAADGQINARANFKISYLAWDHLLAESMSVYGWHKQYLLAFNSTLFKKDGTDVLVLKKGFTPLTGIALDRDYAFGITFDMAQPLGSKATFTDVSNRIDSYKELPVQPAIKVGEEHSLPDTVTAVLATGEEISLPVTWEWTVAEETGNLTNTGTVAVGGYTFLEGLSDKITVTVPVINDATLQAESASLDLGSIEYTGKPLSVYKITVLFDEEADDSLNGDAFNSVNNITLNGTTLRDIRSSLAPTWQNIAFSCTWTAADGMRALEIVLPADTQALKNDGTDVLVLPGGLAVPEFNSLAEAVTMPALQAVAKTAQIIDIGSLSDLDIADGSDGTMRSFYSLYIALSLPSQGTIGGLELTSVIEENIYLNGQPMSAYLDSLAASMFVQLNTNAQNYPLLIGEDGQTNDFSKYSDHAILVVVMHGGFMKNADGSYIGGNIFEIKKELSPALGFTLDKDYAYAIRLHQGETVENSFAAIDVANTVRSLNLPARIGIGQNYPTTVEASMADGSVKTLSVTSDWVAKEETGSYSVTVTVSNPDNLSMLDGTGFIVTYNVEVYDYIVSFGTLADINAPYNATFGSLALPQTVSATTAAGETVSCDIEWQSAGFDGTVSGEQTLTGTVYPANGYELSAGLSARISVKVIVADAPAAKKVIVSIASIPDPAAIQLGQTHGLPDTVTATLDDGTDVELEVRWSWTTATQVGQITVTGTVSTGDYELGDGVSATITKTVTVTAAEGSNGNGGGCSSKVSSGAAIAALFALGGAVCMAVLKRKAK